MSSLLEEKRVPKESLRFKSPIEKFGLSPRQISLVIKTNRPRKGGKIGFFWLSLGKKGTTYFSGQSEAAMTYAMRQIEARGKKIACSDDWLYVHNFDNPS